MWGYYLPHNMVCPDCAMSLTDWRGSDGPNFMVVWQQDSPHPVDHKVDPDFRLPEDSWLRYRLADRILLATTQDGHVATATGVCDGGTWRLTYLHHATTYGCLDDSGQRGPGRAAP